MIIINESYLLANIVRDNCKLVDIEIFSTKGLLNYYKIKKELSSIEIEYKKNRAVFDKLKEQYPDDRINDQNEKLYYFCLYIFSK